MKRMPANITRIGLALPVLVAAAMSGVGGKASASPPKLSSPTDGYVYFNRPGASWEELSRDLITCASVAERANVMWNGKSSPYVGILPHLLQSGQAAGARTANLENCMVVGGWRVIRLAEAKGSALARLDRGGLAEQLSQWVGVDQPEGEVVRVWANDAGKPDTIKQGMPPIKSRKSLSEAAIEISKADLPFYDIKLAASIELDTPQPLSPDQLSRLQLNKQAIVVATLIAPNPRGASMRGIGRQEAAQRNLGGFGMSLAHGGWASFQSNGKLRIESFNLNIFDRSRSEDPIVRTEAFLVSAGRWSFGTGTLKLCLGAPFIEVEPGDVIFAGAFDMGAKQLTPEMDLARAQAHLRSAPGLLAKLRPAQWQNGHTVSCDGPYSLLPVYALEFPDAPNAEGYRAAGRP
ncbi:MAG: hypothetical protein ACOY5Y_11605 [Pseudomonadota bacterium]